ncbi:hypothetical protein [Streptomyces sp. NBC_01276]|uniref:hypothetical protein n=1 Tax=Streptomyces sp. NBC_01276 TaxID=2903808 RepID=UPI002F910D8E
MKTLLTAAEVSDAGRVARPLVLGAVVLAALWWGTRGWRQGSAHRRWTVIAGMMAATVASGTWAVAEARQTGPAKPEQAVSQYPRVRPGPAPEWAGRLRLLTGPEANQADAQWPPLMPGDRWFYTATRESAPTAVLYVRAATADPVWTIQRLIHTAQTPGGEKGPEPFGENGPDGRIWCARGEVPHEGGDPVPSAYCYWGGQLSEGAVILPHETDLNTAAATTRTFRAALATGSKPPAPQA